MRGVGERNENQNTMKQLNQNQLRAVQSPSKKLAVVAGAGSGKTATTVARITRLIVDEGVDPGEVVAVTFTNAGASELEARVATAVGPGRRLGFVGTLHALMINLLTKHARLVGLPRTISVFDDDQKQ